MSSVDDGRPVRYKLGTPKGWERAVNSMEWKEVSTDLYRKVGKCPNCHHELNFEIQKVAFLTSTIQVTCQCDTEHEGSKGEKGCGSFGDVDAP